MVTKSEDTLIFFAISPDTTNIAIILDYLGNFFMKKSEIDPTDRFSLLTYSKEGPTHFKEFTHNGEYIIKKTRELTLEITDVNASSGISLAISLFMDTFKIVNGKVYRLIILMDQKTPRLQNIEILEDLINLVKDFPVIIDVIRIDTYDTKEDRVLLNFIRPTNGSLYYAENEDEAGNILYDLSKKKEFKGVSFGDTEIFKISEENSGLIDFMAEEPVEVINENEDMSCQICGEGTHLHKCPQCGVTSHKKCLVIWAKYSNVGLPNIFRCQNCFFLIRIDNTFLENIQNNLKPNEDIEAFLHNTRVLLNLEQEKKLKEKEGEEIDIIHQEDPMPQMDEKMIDEDLGDYDLHKDIDDIEIVLCPNCGKMTTNEYRVCSDCNTKLF
ncbi:MAG: hypothetical protein GY870_18490 [archaeon]|nr:hypothetical protein [archaeon]